MSFFFFNFYNFVPAFHQWFPKLESWDAFEVLKCFAEASLHPAIYSLSHVCELLVRAKPDLGAGAAVESVTHMAGFWGVETGLIKS